MILRHRARQAIAVAIVWLLAELLALTAIAHSPLRSGAAMVYRGNPFGALAVGAALIFFFGGKPTRRAFALTAAVGVALELGLGALSVAAGWAASYGQAVTRAPGFGIGFAALVALAVDARRTRGEAVNRLLTAILLPAIVVLSSFFLQLTETLQPRVHDFQVYVAESGFGFQPSWVAGLGLQKIRLLRGLCVAVYVSLPLILAGTYAAHDLRGDRQGTDVFDAFLAIGLFGFVGYHLLPVVGPTFAFRAVWPNAAPVAAEVPATAIVLPGFPRNCWPSLHTAWILSVAIHSRGLSRIVRAIVLALVAITLLATLGLGWHYLLDLVIAVPFTAAVEAALDARKGASRRALVAFGALAVVVWCLLLRHHPRMGAWVVPLSAITVAVPITLLRRLFVVPVPSREEEAPPSPRSWMAAATGFVLLAQSSIMGMRTVEGAPTLIAMFAVGAALGALAASRIRAQPIVVFAAAQGVLAVYCAVLPSAIHSLAALPIAFLAGLAVAALSRQATGLWTMPIGAACAAIVTAYALVPLLGVRGASWTASAIGLFCCLFALRGERTPNASELSKAPSHLWIAAVGFVAFAFGVVAMHLVDALVGSSPYASALVLLAITSSLAIAAKLPDLGWIALAVAAIAILVSVFVWSGAPLYLASFAGYPLTRTFGAREVVRGLVCCLAVGPTFGALGAGVARKMERESAVVAALLAGSAGAVAAHALLPKLGSFRTLQLLATSAAVLAAFAFLAETQKKRWSTAIPASIVFAIVLLAQPRSFDAKRIAAGAHVYFGGQDWGQPVAWAESSTAVSMLTRSDDGLVLQRNGRFVDDTSIGRLRRGSTLLGLAHAAARSRFAVIGLGTGTDLALLEDAGVAEIDVVESDSSTVQLAKNELGAANEGVLARPNVHLHVMNPRTFLARGEDRFDLVSVGLGPPLSREVVRLAVGRLAPGGVFVQQVLLHHVTREDILVMLSTARAELPVVQLFVLGDRGALVGCMQSCEPGSDGRALLAQRALSAATVDALWAELQRTTGGEPLLSTDDNRFLELDLVRTDVRDYGASLEDNLRWLSSFRARNP